MDSKAAKTGSGLSTMPAPPPYGVSSTFLYLSEQKSRGLYVLTAMRLLWMPRPTIPVEQYELISSGNRVMTWKVSILNEALPDTACDLSTAREPVAVAIQLRRCAGHAINTAWYFDFPPAASKPRQKQKILTRVVAPWSHLMSNWQWNRGWHEDGSILDLAVLAKAS